MSALPIMKMVGFDSPTAHPGEWMEINDAHARSGLSLGHLRRQCLESWQSAGLARKNVGRSGQSIWFIRSDADPSLAPSRSVPAATDDAADVRNLTDANRQELFKRQMIVQRLQVIRSGAIAGRVSVKRAEKDFVARLTIEGTPVAARTLNYWLERFEADKLPGLIDRRWKATPNALRRQEDEFLQIARCYYLHENEPSKKEAWRWACQAASEQGIARRSQSVTVRFLRSIPLSVIALHRGGPTYFNDTASPHIIRDYTTLASNESWVGDHHQMDVWVNCGTEHQPDYRRPWLTVWMDERSRKIMGWCLAAHDPNQNSILSALRGAVLANGVPRRFYIDNGKDYDSYTLQGVTKVQRHKGRIVLDEKHIGGVFGALECTAKHAWAYHGQSKCIERWFGTLERSFGKWWDTYCGSSPKDRPENCFDKIKAGKAPMFDHYMLRLEIWVEQCYHQDGSLAEGLDGQNPEHTYADSWNDTSKRTAAPELLEILLQKVTRPMTVARNGVKFMGLVYSMPIDHWIAWQGKEVYLRVDERCVNHVTVWSPEDRFICAAESADKIPANATEEILRAAIRERATRIRAVKTYYQKGRQSGESIADIATRAALEQKRTADSSQTAPDSEGGPAAIRPVRSDIELQLPQIRRQVSLLRPAVGMEGTSQVAEQRTRFSYAPAAPSVLTEDKPVFRYVGGDGGDDE